MAAWRCAVIAVAGSPARAWDDSRATAAVATSQPERATDLEFLMRFPQPVI